MQYSSATLGGGVNYVTEIRRFPMLKPDEEFMLAARWRDRGDESAAHRLVTSHLRLVVKIAIAYRGYGLPTSDLISEGSIGLMQALKRFVSDKRIRFATYDTWWIKAAIQNYILRSWSLVKMGTTANQKKLFFNLGKAKRQISAFQEGDLRPDQVGVIARGLAVAEQDVVEMNRRMTGDASLNLPINEENDSTEWQERLVEEAANQENQFAEGEESNTRRQALGVALKTLNARERRVFEARRLMDVPLTLDELASEFRISPERTRQIEMRAFQKVQKATHLAYARRGRGNYLARPVRQHRLSNERPVIGER